MIIKLLLFDYDDTLVKTRECKFQAVAELGKRFYSKELGIREIEQAWGEPYHLFFEKLLGTCDSDIGRIIERYQSLNEEFPVMAFSDAVVVIDSLAKHCLLGIVSACGRHQLIGQLLLNNFLLCKFEFIITSEDVEFHKPDPRVFDKVKLFMSKRGITDDEVLYVGDSVRDLLAAKGAGFHFIGLSRSPKEAEAMQAHGATVVPSLTQVLEFVRATER